MRSTRFGEGGGQLDRGRARGVLNPCARELNAPTGEFLRVKLISDHVCFLPTRANKEWRTGKIREAFFKDARVFGRLDVDSRAGFYQLKGSTTMDLGFSIFLI